MVDPTEPVVMADESVIAGLDYWRTLPVKQQPQWPDAEAVEAASAHIATLPPLVFAGEVDIMRTRLAAADGIAEDTDTRLAGLADFERSAWFIAFVPLRIADRVMAESVRCRYRLRKSLLARFAICSPGSSLPYSPEESRKGCRIHAPRNNRLYSNKRGSLADNFLASGCMGLISAADSSGTMTDGTWRMALDMPRGHSALAHCAKNATENESRGPV